MYSEIEIIRPLFKQHNIEDVLEKIKSYCMYDWTYEYIPQNINPMRVFTLNAKFYYKDVCFSLSEMMSMISSLDIKLNKIIVKSKSNKPNRYKLYNKYFNIYVCIVLYNDIDLCYINCYITFHYQDDEDMIFNGPGMMNCHMRLNMNKIDL